MMLVLNANGHVYIPRDPESANLIVDIAAENGRVVQSAAVEYDLVPSFLHGLLSTQVGDMETEGFEYGPADTDEESDGAEGTTPSDGVGAGGDGMPPGIDEDEAERRRQETS